MINMDAFVLTVRILPSRGYRCSLFYCLSSGIATPFLLTLQSYHMLSFWQWIKALRNYYRIYLLTEINQLCAHTAD